MRSVSVIDAQGPELDGLVSEWRRLANQRGNPFATPEWYFATATGPPRIVSIRRDDGTLVGVLPLVVDSWRGIRALRFGGYGLGDRFHPVATLADEDEFAAESITALSKSGEGRIAFDKCANDSGWLDRFRGRGEDGRSFRRISSEDLPRIELAGRDWDSYLGGLSKNLRSRIGRMERKLIREHGMTIRSIREASELEVAFETLFSLHDARRDELGGTALSSERHRLQLLDFCRSALAQGWLRLRIMDCDGHPVAAFLGWRVGDSYSFYQSGFDPNWGRLSVGLVNLALAVRDAFEEGATEFDLLLGDEAYKQRLADSSREVTSGILTGRFDVAAGMAHAETRLKPVIRRARAVRDRSRRARGPASA